MNQTDQRDQRKDQFEDEIELIDYLRVVWKWKWLIIGGTLLCILAVAIYGFTRPVVKMYRVSTLIEIDPKAKLDPLDRIKSMIEYGIFSQQVLNDLSDLQGISKPQHLAFEVNIPKGLNMLDIAYETLNADLGKAVLDSLAKQLEHNYRGSIDQRRFDLDEAIKKKNESIEKIHYKTELMKKQFEVKVAEIRGKIKEHAATIEALREKIRIVRNRIDQMEKVLQQAQSNTAKLADKTIATTLDSQDEASHVNVFLQSSAIQQIIDYPIVLRERIDSLAFEEKAFSKDILINDNTRKRLEKDIEILRLKHESEIRVEEEKIPSLESEIESLIRNRDKITGVILKQPATASLLPIKYKAKRNALLAGVVGFFFLVFLGFFIEYLKNASKRAQKAV